MYMRETQHTQQTTMINHFHSLATHNYPTADGTFSIILSKLLEFWKNRLSGNWLIFLDISAVSDIGITSTYYYNAQYGWLATVSYCFKK